MLILPLHKPLTLATLPLMTMLLLLVNVVIYFGWQLPDAGKLDQAMAYYAHSGLEAIEQPAHERYQQRNGVMQAQDAQDPDAVQAPFAMSTLGDVRFAAALASGELFDTPAQQTHWQQLRAPYDALLGEVFTLRHLLRQSEWSPARMLSSAFLHGDAMHLIGNMLFLLLIGLLLEGAIGSGGVLAVYLLGALGASAASLAWRWGEAGSALGASGAVAAMMGAFCVVWGRRPVRFFYWVGVIFDYVRAPAIWLLPLWLGWEVVNLAFNKGANIGFDAHAGGLLCGALLGAVPVKAGRVRNGYIAQDPVVVDDHRWTQAQQHLGRLENARAETLLEALAAEQPHRVDVAVAHCRVAINAGIPTLALPRGLRALQLATLDADAAALQRDLARQLLRTALPLDDRSGPLLVRAGMVHGWLIEVEQVLQIDSSVWALDSRATLWLRLALQHGEQGHPLEQQRLLQRLVQQHPALPQADKARFLLENA